MTDISEILQQLRKAESRIQGLEEMNRRVLDALNSVASIGDFQLVMNPLQDENAILAAARENLGRLAGFRVKAFFTLAPDEVEMTLADCEPAIEREQIQTVVDRMIDEGTFAWALNQNRPLSVQLQSTGETLVLHVLATRTHVQGMFVGILSQEEGELSDIIMNLMSILLFASANALETSALYKKVSDYNKELERTVEERTRDLREALEQAQVANVAKRQFLANMSHEVRTPLNGVMGLVDLLAETDLNEEQKGYIDIIRGSSTALLTVINDILDFSKIEAGKMSLDMGPFSLRKVVEQSVHLFRGRAEEKGVTIEKSVHGIIPEMLLGDAVRITQVLNNLIGNAVKFTDKGKIVVALRLESLNNQQATIRVMVTDSGIGISPDHQKALFQLFSQVDQSATRKFGGTGLGLAISKQLVDLMGGDIGVESVSGKGSTFWFTMVLQCLDVPPTVPEDEAEPVAEHDPAAMDLSHLRILVAEDNEANRLVASIMLDKLGCQCDFVSNGSDAVQQLFSKDYEVVLMDCHMPIMDGFEATRMIRRLEPKASRHPIIALTASTLQGEKERCLAAGMDDFLGKPILLDDLAAKLIHWTGKTKRANAQAENGTEETQPLTSLDHERLTHLRDLSKRHDPGMFERIVRSFLDDAPVRIITMWHALETKDAESFFSAAHSLKGLSGNLGAQKMLSLSQRLQMVGQSGMLSGAEGMVHELEKEFQTVKEDLQTQYLACEVRS